MHIFHCKIVRSTNQKIQIKEDGPVSLVIYACIKCQSYIPGFIQGMRKAQYKLNFLKHQNYLSKRCG